MSRKLALVLAFLVVLVSSPAYSRNSTAYSGKQAPPDSVFQQQDNPAPVMNSTTTAHQKKAGHKHAKVNKHKKQ